MSTQKMLSMSRLMTSKEKISKYDTIIINMDKSRRKNIDIIGGNVLCNHQHVKNQSCVKCGAFVGHVGFEENTIKFYYHINFLCNLFQAENVYVIHNRLIPVDFKSFSTISKASVNYHRSVIFAKDSIINVYSKTRNKQKYMFTEKNYFQFMISLRNIGSVFWVNPTNEEKQLKSDFLIFEGK